MGRLRNTGHQWKHTRLGRVYGQRRLNGPRRTKKRVPVRVVPPLGVRPQPNVGWAVDFRSATRYGGRRVRTFNLLAEGVRAGLAIEVDISLPAERVIRVLEQVPAWRGPPQTIRLNNGPEFLADRFAGWCADRGIALRYIQAGKPNQNAFVERFHRTFRHAVLDAYVFESLDQVREISAAWRREYNEERPHDTLDGMPPSVFRAHQTVGSSPLILSP